MEDYHVCKRNGRNSVQIPAFGDWDRANELPITQYFRCATQAGLIRFRSFSSEEVPYPFVGDFFTPDRKRVVRSSPPASLKTREREMRNQMVKDQRKQRQWKVCDVTEPPRKTMSNNAVPPSPMPKAMAPKPVDEDLYKIPPHLLHTSKRVSFFAFSIDLNLILKPSSLTGLLDLVLPTGPAQTQKGSQTITPPPNCEEEVVDLTANQTKLQCLKIPH